MNRVEVVIPVLNGMDTIEACIKGLLSQTVRPVKIIAIDSGSKDGTVEFLKSIPEVELVEIPAAEFNHGETRNLGWKYCQEDFIFFTVQDAIPTNNTLLETMLKHFKNDQVAGVCGQQIVEHDPNKNPIQWFRPVHEASVSVVSISSKENFQKLTPSAKDKLTAWDDVVAMYRLSVLKSTPFRKTLYGEDKLWAMDALSAGYSLVVDSNAKVYHYHHYDYKQAYNRYFVSTYLKYKSVGLVPQEPPPLGMKKKLTWLKLLFKSKGVSVFEFPKWIRYNTAMYTAMTNARKDFNQAMSDETTLNNLYLKACGVSNRV